MLLLGQGGEVGVDLDGKPDQADRLVLVAQGPVSRSRAGHDQRARAAAG